MPVGDPREDLTRPSLLNATDILQCSISEFDVPSTVLDGLSRSSSWVPLPCASLFDESLRRHHGDERLAVEIARNAWRRQHGWNAERHDELQAVAGNLLSMSLRRTLKGGALPHESLGVGWLAASSEEILNRCIPRDHGPRSRTWLYLSGSACHSETTGVASTRSFSPLAIRDRIASQRPVGVVVEGTVPPAREAWEVLRRETRKTNVLLIADLSHTAGALAAGLVPSPLPYVDLALIPAAAFLCPSPLTYLVFGPDSRLSKTSDTGLHLPQTDRPLLPVGGLLASLTYATTQEHCALRQHATEAASALAAAFDHPRLTAQATPGSHIVTLRLSSSCDGTAPVDESTLARILLSAGITSTAQPSNDAAPAGSTLLLSTLWAAQHGLPADTLSAAADWVSEIFDGIRPYDVPTSNGVHHRGRILVSQLKKTRVRVRQLVQTSDHPQSAAVSQAMHGWRILRLQGPGARSLLHEATPADILHLGQRETVRTWFFYREGVSIAEVIVGCLGEADYLVLVPQRHGLKLLVWLQGLVDGVTVFDEDDSYRQMAHPAHVETVDPERLPAEARAWLEESPTPDTYLLDIRKLYASNPSRFVLGKPYFVSQDFLLDTVSVSNLESAPVSSDPSDCARLPLRLTDAGIERNGSIERIAQLEQTFEAVCCQGGILPMADPGILRAHGPDARLFLDVVFTARVDALAPGETLYGLFLTPTGHPLVDAHIHCAAPEHFWIVPTVPCEALHTHLEAVRTEQISIDPEHPKRAACAGRVTLERPDKPAFVSQLIGPATKPLGNERLAASDGDTPGATALFLIDRRFRGLQAVLQVAVEGEGHGIVHRNRPLQAALARRVPLDQAAWQTIRVSSGVSAMNREIGGERKIHPLEADLGEAVRLDKTFFVGRSACVAKHADIGRKVVRLRSEVPLHIEAGALLCTPVGKRMGTFTSAGLFSPRLPALAVMNRPVPLPGAEFEILVSDPRDSSPCTVRLTVLERSDDSTCAARKSIDS